MTKINKDGYVVFDTETSSWGTPYTYYYTRGYRPKRYEIHIVTRADGDKVPIKIYDVPYPLFKAASNCDVIRKCMERRTVYPNINDPDGVTKLEIFMKGS